MLESSAHADDILPYLASQPARYLSGYKHALFFRFPLFTSHLLCISHPHLHSNAATSAATPNPSAGSANWVAAPDFAELVVLPPELPAVEDPPVELPPLELPPLLEDPEAIVDMPEALLLIADMALLAAVTAPEAADRADPEAADAAEPVAATATVLGVPAGTVATAGWVVTARGWLVTATPPAAPVGWPVTTPTELVSERKGMLGLPWERC